MEEKLLNKLRGRLIQAGPFTDYNHDKEVVNELIAWIEGDWQRMRLLLNYTFEEGIREAYRILEIKTEQLAASSRHRSESRWERDLLSL